jgi:2-dehydropantoate 2-reductase
MTEATRPMRVLVVGAGAIGGYFGGRLAEAGRDVTFLVRPGRAALLARDGLVIRSPRGDVVLAPATVLAEQIERPFDLIVLSCKAYDLDSAMDGIARAVGRGTVILPLLNGIAHIDALDARFPGAHVFGGQCAISSTLDRSGAVLHLADGASLSFGARDAAGAERVAAVSAVMLGTAGFEARASPAIMQDMWEKWVFLATLAAMTCLMRSAVGDIVTAGGEGAIRGVFEECRSTAAAEGFAPRETHTTRSLAMVTSPASKFTASMLRDVENGGRTEADHVIGDLLRRRDAHFGGEDGLLRVAYLHLKAYEARRLREAAEKG